MAQTIAEQIAAIDVKIAELIDSPQVDYTEGDVTVKAGQKMTQLLAARKVLVASPVEATFESIHFENSIDEFGIRH